MYPRHFHARRPSLAQCIRAYCRSSQLCRLSRDRHEKMTRNNNILVFDGQNRNAPLRFIAPVAFAGAVYVWSAGLAWIQLLMGRAFIEMAFGFGQTHGSNVVRYSKLSSKMYKICPRKEEHRPDFLSQCCCGFCCQ